ncbi:MAG: carboxypeptidase regulatory-like domain-containing protein [Acidobacteria bacterium]|nr:carboxypeptidase regulatory-like domain-containing protein [Acidobacteriota bacterium]
MRRRLILLLLSVALGGALSLSAQGPPFGPLQGRGADQPLQGRGAGRGQAPVRDPREQTAGSSIMRGRIVAADTGTPIRRAQVRATSGAQRAHLASTDADGRFEFDDLPAGRWNLTASKAGFVTLRYGQRRPFEAGRPIELADAQILDRVDFALPRGAVITGRVFDEFGDPVAGARVQVLRYQLVQGTRRLMPTGAAGQSDDTGAFRVYGLMPGDYYVSATLRALPVDDPDDVTTYAPTYFPGTGSVTEARAVSLALGQELSGINFALLPVRAVRLSGMALDSTGMPLSNGTVMLSLADQGVGPVAQVGGGTRIGTGGRFSIPNVAPGSYTLTVVNGGGRIGGGGRLGGGGDVELASMALTVGSEDLDGITIVTGRGATLSGTIAAARDATATLAVNGIQVNVQTIGPVRGVPARPGRAGADGSFQLTNLFGQGLVRVNGIPQGWTLKSVTVGDTDVTDTPLLFRPGDEIRGAQILLTNRITALTGTVLTRDGQPTRDYAVVVFPDNETKWTAPSRYIWSTRPDQQGIFKMQGVPASSRYRAVAVDYLEEGEANDPEFLAYVKAVATPFSLGDGESKSLELRLVER